MGMKGQTRLSRVSSCTWAEAKRRLRGNSIGVNG